MRHLYRIIQNKFWTVVLIVLGNKQIPDFLLVNPDHYSIDRNPAVAHGDDAIRQGSQRSIVGYDHKGLVKFIP